MQKYILIPSYMLESHRLFRTKRFLHLFEMLRDRLGFILRFADSNALAIPDDASLVLAYSWGVNGTSYYSRNALSEWGEKNRGTLIGWFGDVHRAGRGADKASFARLLRACDVVLGSWIECFKVRWAEYMPKHVFFPSYFAPYERFASLAFNQKPTMKCLLIGQTREQYPIRAYVRKMVADKAKLRDVIDIQNHPRFPELFSTRKDFVMHDTYAERMNEYFCCVTDGGEPERQVVAKHFEIPATGSLLLADETEDLGAAGFIPNRHYVPINKENILSWIRQVLANPNEYDAIRRNGRAFVLENHSINNRFRQIEKLMERQCKR